LGEWLRLTKRFQHIELDEFCIMPDHHHGILIIDPELFQPFKRMSSGSKHDKPKSNKESISGGLVPGSLGAIVGAYKSTTARLINAMRHSPGAAVWQRNYHEQIIRNEDHWNKVREYIIRNPYNRDKK